jgi:hypothetical protein
MNAFEQGYQANLLSENPFWKDYPNQKTPDDEKIRAWQWVDGYVQKIIDNH